MRFTASAFLGLALFLFGTTAKAQDTPSSQEKPPMTEEEKKKKKLEEEEKRAEAWSQFFFDEVLLRSCDDPTLRSAIALPQPKLILQASDDGKTKVKARVGLEVKRRFVASLEVESPRNASGETTLASLDGLSNGSTAELKFSWFRPQDKQKAILEMIQGVAPSVKEVDKEMGTILRSAEDTGSKWRMADYMNSVFSRPSGIAAAGPKKYKEATAAYRNWIREYNPMIPVYTIKFNAEQKGFDFFLPSAGPPAGLKKTSEFHTDYQITGSAGAYLWGTVYSSLNYLRGTEFKTGATKDFCAASSLTGVLNCETLVIAPPKQKRGEVLEFEARGLAGNFGFGGHITRDLRANVTVVEIPVYILQKLGTSEMELNLGARLQWRSDTKDYAISVFLGPALSTVLRR